MKFTSQVPRQRGTPCCLADYLAGRFTYYDRAEWIGLIADGRLAIDGRIASVNDSVRGGQTVAYDAGDFEEPPADLRYQVIYEDEWLFAVNKPGNLLIHRAGRSFRHNLMYQLRFVHRPNYPAAHSIHRLDRNTSGVVLIAKSPSIQAEVSLQFKQREVEKTYIAFVHGVPRRSGWVIDKPIAEDTAAETGTKFRVDISGKDAVTRIEACEAIGTSFAQLIIVPLTGRTHQIRVHCASVGHPIVGDKRYGSDEEFPDTDATAASAPGYHQFQSRHALHCSRISFYHPWLQKECAIAAPLPDDMLRLKEYLQRRTTAASGKV